MTYLSNEIRFAHHRTHRIKPGEPHWKAQRVPKLLVEFLRTLPKQVLVETCDSMGHPSFWHAPGYRYRCICGELTYHD